MRKEKMEDTMGTLHQSVSPFGKTDTACVLNETIEYIKFLHGQISAFLSTMYKKNGAPTEHHQQNSNKQEDPERLHHDLRSRGLFLVLVSSAFLLIHEPTVAFGALHLEELPDKNWISEGPQTEMGEIPTKRNN